jgi:hypothetical protein
MRCLQPLARLIPPNLLCHHDYDGDLLASSIIEDPSVAQTQCSKVRVQFGAPRPLCLSAAVILIERLVNASGKHNEPPSSLGLLRPKLVVTYSVLMDETTSRSPKDGMYHQNRPQLMRCIGPDSFAVKGKPFNQAIVSEDGEQATHLISCQELGFDPVNIRKYY